MRDWQILPLGRNAGFALKFTRSIKLPQLLASFIFDNDKHLPLSAKAGTGDPAISRNHKLILLDCLGRIGGGKPAMDCYDDDRQCRHDQNRHDDGHCPDQPKIPDNSRWCFGVCFR